MLAFKMRNGTAGTYQPTKEDIIWMLRAVTSEGPVQSQVAQTLVNCFCYLRSRGYKGTLTGLVRAYAQPVNPRWYLDGDLYKKAKLFGTPAGMAAARRREKVHSAVTTFSDSVYKAVEQALECGLTDVPANCQDYAAPNIDASGKGYVLLSAHKPKGVNWLWSRDVKWSGYRVTC